jgi:ABC-2 type transport system permease protein
MMPAILPSILASESVAGEKERNTLESLLATPLTDGEILFGKILSSAVPSIIVVWLSSIPYVVLVDFFLYKELGFILLPDFRFIILMGIVAPLLVFASVTAMIWLSTRVKADRDAQQLSILIVLPLLTIVMVEVIGFMFSPLFLLSGILILIFIDILIYYLVKRSFNREFLLSKI